jgi:hypothetical protein
LIFGASEFGTSTQLFDLVFVNKGEIAVVAGKAFECHSHLDAAKAIAAEILAWCEIHLPAIKHYFMLIPNIDDYFSTSDRGGPLSSGGPFPLVR